MTTISPVNRAIGSASIDGGPPAPAVDAPATLLPPPLASGLSDGSVAELAMLLTQADQQDRAASRQVASAADQAATHEENERVHQLQDRAAADESQGLWKGAGEIAGGVCLGGSAFSQPCGSHALLEGGSKVAPGIGTILEGAFKADADRADAAAASAEAQAQGDVRLYNRAHDDAQAADASIHRVEQFLDRVQQTENATRLAAATYRA